MSRNPERIAINCLDLNLMFLMRCDEPLLDKFQYTLNNKQDSRQFLPNDSMITPRKMVLLTLVNNRS